MKAMILAAGTGTRLRPITNDIAKPMIPLLQKPILESIIEHLEKCDIKEIIINTSYLSDQIESYFGNGHRFGVEIAYSYEGEIISNELFSKALGSAGGLKNVQDKFAFFDDTFVVLCADALIDLNIQEVINEHKKNKAFATIALKEVGSEEVEKYGIVQLDSNNRVLQFQEKPKKEDAVSNLANTGIYIFEPNIFRYIPNDKFFDIGSDLLPKLANETKKLYGINIPYEWNDIGNIKDFYKTTFKVLKKEVKDFVIPAKEVKEGIYLGLNVKINLNKVTLVPPIFIGSSTIVENGAIIIGPVVISSNCHIQKNVFLQECIIDDYKRIHPLAKIKNKILSGSHIISFDETIVNIEQSDISWLIEDSRAKHVKTSLEIRLNDIVKKEAL